MKFSNLRLVGFKSFVETTDFEIRDGLTGVVGPNGCGKSNILEGLRWVMGATSAKALRGEGMADVIFSGTSARPARNWAEVTLTLDNANRTAPGEYNDSTVIEVSRRILNRDDGTQSIYRINNQEVRARDVQLLFADAATGANSPALVRQGQVAELINAKPQNRRRLLEDAAGVTGLHTRRHEAELRLRAAEQNLERLNDVIGELETQKAALARQARQATRYRNLSGDIRRTEAMAAFLRWNESVAQREDAEESVTALNLAVEDTARAAASASTSLIEARDALDPLRLSEAEAAAGLHRLTVARETIEDEARRAAAELARLSAEIERLANDETREAELAADAEAALDTLGREDESLKAREAAEQERLAAAETAMRETAETLAGEERAHDARSREAADFEARRRATAAAIDDADRRLAKIRAQIEQLETERAALAPTPEQARLAEEAIARLAASEEAARAADAAFQRAEEERAAADAAEAAAKAPRLRAEQSLAEIIAERDGLKRALDTASSGDWPALIEKIAVEPGYENALAAALGDDLGAALSDEAPAHWSVLGGSPLAEANALPEGASALSGFVEAPGPLARRLAAVGVVERSEGARLQATLAAGQRLVSREGDLWRWDGFVARAEAKTAAAIRLEQRNRLAALAGDIEGAQARLERARADHDAAARELSRRQETERDARFLLTEARRAIDSARVRVADLERENQRSTTRLAAVADALTRLGDDQRDAAASHESRRADLASLPDAALLAQDLSTLRERVVSARATASEARAAFGDLTRESKSRADRLSEIARERGVWGARGETARRRIADIRTRLAEAQAARAAAADEPQKLEERRLALLDLLSEAEGKRRIAGDALAAAIARAQDCERNARAADSAAAEAREARARAEAQLEAAVQRVEEARRLGLESCEAEPDRLLDIAEHKEERDLPSREDTDRKLERYKREREALGGVNLRADEEMQEVSQRLDELAAEREDCEGAVRKLRAAIGGLNREARQRLNEAFETVNRNFTSLFTRLFNGGQAELRLIDSEDPLEAGLEIYASPPGKKLSSMSLMSGGEQALTATALIFAVFMANPAPVCVLDEVDAPLDDANVERFCRLLNEIAAETQTRFVVITHHALTMSRMDRLYGVTMIERGVSQLVSVDLKRAEQLAAAE